MSDTLKPIDWKKYALRQCRYLDHCRLCEQSIVAGEMYYDGGYGRRAHKTCVGQREMRLEPASE